MFEINRRAFIGFGQRCADPEIFESASVRRFWSRIRCQSASATREKYL